jgi:HEAT repeat protein
MTIRDQASHAIVVLSDAYLKTHYSRVEFDILKERNIPIIAIVIDEVSTELLAEIEPDYWIDCRACHEDHLLRANIGVILEHLPQPEERINHTERAYYLRDLITDFEIELSDLPTSRAAKIWHDDSLKQSHKIRQRGYDHNLLTEWYFTHRNGNSTLEVENISSWFEARPQFVLCGPSGNGKTVISQLLMLQSAHQALGDTSVALPVWLDLRKWDEHPSFEEFIHSQWPLAFYWKHWMDTNQAFIVFDNWSDFCVLHPEHKEDLTAWIETAHNHKIIILTQNEADIDLDFPILHLDSVPIGQIPRFTDVFLQGRRKDIFKRLVSNHAGKVRFSTLDFISCGIELVALDSVKAVDTWHISPIISLVTARWEHNIKTIQPTISLDYFITTLQTLAWDMLQQEHYRSIAYDDAKQLLLGDAPLQVANDLGLLINVNNQLQFQSGIFQWHLATQHLESDGIYKHLSRPKFLSNGQRQASKWDNVVLALVDHVPDEQQQRMIEQIAEIDPYLAYICLQRDPDLYKAYLQPIIEKLIEVRGKNPRSQLALSAILHHIPYVEDTIITLMQQMPSLDWGSQISMWQILLSLPLNIPTEFVNRVEQIERDFPDSAFDLLSDSPSLQHVAYLAHLIHDVEPKIQHNAIWLSGILEPVAMKVGLFNLLDDPSLKIVQNVLRALANVQNDDDLIQQLLIWVRSHLDYSGELGRAIYKMGRPISGNLLKLTHDSEHVVSDELRNALIKYSEDDIAIAVAQFIVTEPELRAVLNKIAGERENVMKVHKLLQSTLQQLPHEGLNRLMDDFNRRLSLQTDNDTEESLYQRTQSAIVSANTTETMAVVVLPDIPDAIHDSLTSQDQLQRQDAVEQLVKYQAEQVVPLLTQAIDDSEEKVQIAALRGLAQISQHESARYALITSLTHENHAVIDTATDLLKTIDHLDAGELLHLLGSENVQTLTGVIDIMGQTRYQEAVSYLVLSLDDDRKSRLSEKTVSDYAAEALIAIGTQEALDAVNQSSYVQLSMPDAITPTAAEQDVTQSPTQVHTPLEELMLSLNGLRSNNWETSQDAARGLRNLVKAHQGTEDIELVQTLCDALSDSNEHVRLAVAEALAWLQHPAAIQSLGNHLQDPEWTVIVAAMRSLAVLQATDYAPKIATHLNYKNHVVREATAEVLGILGNPDVIPMLGKLLESDDEFLRLVAIQSISQIDSEDTADYLIKVLHDDDVHVRWFAMKQLVTHARPGDAVEIARMLSDMKKPPWEEKAIGDYAIQALLAMNTKKSKAILKKWSTLRKQKLV